MTKNETASCAEGKGVAATVAPSSHILFVGELTHVVLEINFLLSTVLFSIVVFN